MTTSLFESALPVPADLSGLPPVLAHVIRTRGDGDGMSEFESSLPMAQEED